MSRTVRRARRLRRRAAGPLLCLMAGAVLTACGVPTSGVIQAGEPAIGMRPGVSVYFVSDGELRAVPRTAPADAGLRTALRILFDGPAASGTTTLGTELPRLSGAPKVAVHGATVVVSLPPGVARLTPLATGQIACTVAANPLQERPSAADPVPTRPGGQAPAVPPASDGPASPHVPATQDPVSVVAEVRVTGDGWSVSRTTDDCP
ncbi:hypothetical protein ABZ901_17215 [Actinacidiphila alni]|uniref:hypothetical protein n=1 Tax=Actinacidiphila alni TaxID=380248 RepID=UPI0033EC822E